MMGSFGWNTASFTEPLCPGSCQDGQENEHREWEGYTLRESANTESKVRYCSQRRPEQQHGERKGSTLTSMSDTVSYTAPHTSSHITGMPVAPVIHTSNLLSFAFPDEPQRNTSSCTVTSLGDSSPCTVYSSSWSPRRTPSDPHSLQ